MKFMQSQMGRIERQLVRSIVDQPRDNRRRLNYATWLESRGRHDQAELMSLQITEEALTWSCARGDPDRKQDLLYAAHAAISDLIDETGAEVQFHDGLPEVLCVGPETKLGPELARICSELPISSLLVAVDDLDEVVSAFGANKPCLQNFVWGVFPVSGKPETETRGLVTARSAICLAQDEVFDRLLVLNLMQRPITQAQAKMIGRARFLPKLGGLTIAHADLNSEALECMFRNRRFRQLELLALPHNPLGCAGATVLARHAAQLPISSLSLRGTGLQRAGGEILARCEGFDELELLDVAENSLGPCLRHLRKRYPMVCVH